MFFSGWKCRIIIRQKLLRRFWLSSPTIFSLSLLSVPLSVEEVIESVVSDAEVSFVAIVVLDSGSVTERSLNEIVEQILLSTNLSVFCQFDFE